MWPEECRTRDNTNLEKGGEVTEFSPAVSHGLGLFSMLAESGSANQTEEVSTIIEDRDDTMMGAKGDGNCLCGKGMRRGRSSEGKDWEHFCAWYKTLDTVACSLTADSGEGK